MNPKCLTIDRRQRASPLRIFFVLQKKLHAAGNDGQWGIDLVSRAGGQLGHRGQLLGFERFGKSLLKRLQARKPRRQLRQKTARAARVLNRRCMRYQPEEMRVTPGLSDLALDLLAKRRERGKPVSAATSEILDRLRPNGPMRKVQPTS